MGYYLHDILSLRSSWTSDPLMFIHHVANLFGLASIARSEGVNWLVPSLMALEYAPTVPLNVLRMLSELDVPVNAFIWRVMVGGFFATFIGTKVIGIPALMTEHLVRDPKPELHQPNFLAAKSSIVVNLAMQYFWMANALRTQSVFRVVAPLASGALGIAGAPSGARIEQVETGLRLRTLGHGLMKHCANPFFAIAGLAAFQGLYFLPLAIPFALYYARYPQNFARPGSMAAAAGFAGTNHFVRPLASAMMGVVVASAVLPLPQYASERIMTLKVWEALSDYFNFKVVTPEPFEYQNNKSYLAVMAPHGFTPVHVLLYGVHLAREKGILPNTVAADVLFKMPILRHVIGLIGARPATKVLLRDALRSPSPHNVTFVLPGGIAEMFLSRPDIEHVYMKSRKVCLRIPHLCLQRNWLTYLQHDCPPRASSRLRWRRGRRSYQCTSSAAPSSFKWLLGEHRALYPRAIPLSS
jgi:hypothetical protein